MPFLRRISLSARPLGVALGVFIVLNLGLALQRPQLSVTRIWLNAYLPEPELSVFALVLGAALFLPDSMGSASWVRWLCGGIFAGFFLLAVASSVAFYHSLYLGRFSSDVPVPLSAFFALILFLEFFRISFWRPVEGVLPPPAQVFCKGILVAASFLAITLAHIVTFGHIDNRRQADAAVIFGAKIYPDGTPCAALVDRLETGMELYRTGLVGYLIMTGAADANGQVEPLVMKAYAERGGVPASRILLDQEGFNTRASALNCGVLARQRGFERLLAVTQYFHCARVKLIFDREGTPCYTVPTCSAERSVSASQVRLSREGFFLFREAVAFPFYLLYYR